MLRQPWPHMWFRSSSAARLFHPFVVVPLAVGSEQNTRSASASSALCFSIRTLSDLSWAKSPELWTTCITKALFKYLVLFQDLLEPCFILAVLFFLVSLFAVPYCYIYILFENSKKREVFRMCCSLCGHIQVMGDAEEQLNETWLWEIINRTESFHCHF